MSAVKDTFFGGSEKKAGQAQVDASKASVEEQRRQFDITQANLQPFLDAGTGALTQQQALLGLSGVPEQQAAFDAFTSSPGQQFLQDRGQRALLRNSSAIGGLGGGNVRSALVQQGVGFARQDFGNQFNRLAGLSGTGQATGVQLGQFGANAAANIGSILQDAGAARASGILGQAEGRRAGLGFVAQIAASSDIRLKENIIKIGELESGLAWYVWDWTDEAKAIVGGQVAEGVIAQEAIKLFPEAIGEINGYMAVDYARIH